MKKAIGWGIMFGIMLFIDYTSLGPLTQHPIGTLAIVAALAAFLLLTYIASVLISGG